MAFDSIYNLKEGGLTGSKNMYLQFYSKLGPILIILESGELHSSGPQMAL